MGERAIYPDDAADRMKRHAGEPYRPSNGGEGEYFEAAWCDGCRRDAAFRAHFDRDGDLREQPEGCPILVNVHAFDVDDPGYPPEWVYGADGQPTCTAFADKHAPRPAPRCKGTDDLFGLPPSPVGTGRAS